jgi:hypothetical protein
METTFDPIDINSLAEQEHQPIQNSLFSPDVDADAPALPSASASVDPSPSRNIAHNAPAAARSAVLYIDADNQLPLCAEILVEVCRIDLAVDLLRAVIAGNNSGRQVANWSEALRDGAGDIPIQAITVPTRKEAADLALVMELGANLKDHIASGDLIVIVSRDDFLIGAAERARSLGCACIIAYATGAPVNPQGTSLPTLILPMPDRGVPASAAPRGALATEPSSTAGNAQAAAPTTSQILTKVRAELPQQPGGGYGAGPLGTLLAQLGLDAAARKQFLSKTPGVRTVGSGPNKRYLFDN